MQEIYARNLMILIIGLLIVLSVLFALIQGSL
jgi:hypothetical protein